MKIDVNSKYTCNGKPIRILYKNSNNPDYPVIGVLDSEVITCFTEDGQCEHGPKYDLVEDYEPKSGEWCWFWDDRSKHIVHLRQYLMLSDNYFVSTDNLTWDNFAKFIGELPDFSEGYEPEPGEWCWLWDDHSEGIAHLRQYSMMRDNYFVSTDNLTWNNCSKFIGELPDHLKEFINESKEEEMLEENGFITYTAEELKEILILHKKWLNGEYGGIRADLSSTNLSSTNLSYADLRYANMSFANLCSADLSYANLRSADLNYVDLSSANLFSADLSYTNLNTADLSSANINFTNLSFANLRAADLSYTNLSSADLRYAIGEMKSVKSFQLEKYMISYTTTMMSIGYLNHTIEEWKNFDDETIKRMDYDALEWWKKWKPVIFQIIEMSPAEPTGYVGSDKK